MSKTISQNKNKLQLEDEYQSSTNGASDLQRRLEEFQKLRDEAKNMLPLSEETKSESRPGINSANRLETDDAHTMD